MRRLAPLFPLIFLLSCQFGPRPAGVLDQDRFVVVYCDMLQESLRSRNAKADAHTSAGNAAAVLDRTGISRDTYEATVRWYNEDVSRWKRFMDEVAQELERRESTPLHGR